MIVHYPASDRSRISGKKWAQVASLTPAVQRGQRKNVFLLVSSHDGKKNWTIFEEKMDWGQKNAFLERQRFRDAHVAVQAPGGLQDSFLSQKI